MFGIITASGLHFERHHQGWYDIDPMQHRLMVNGSSPEFVKKPKVYTMDDIMRLPFVSRIHFIECGANTGMEWGNVAVPTVQYTHGMLSCSEFTGVPLRVLLEDCGADMTKKFVLAEGADGSAMTPQSFWRNEVLSAEVLPGDTIVLPEKQDRETTWSAVFRNTKDITQILYQLGLGAAAIKTLRQ